MRVRSERAQKAEITGTRRAESPRRSRCTTSQGARPEDARQIGLIRARSRSLMNNAGQGMVEEGIALVRAVRDRYDGRWRNPWNEVEFGSHYARAMSSWSLLLALSGFHYSGPERRIEFAPQLNARAFRSFFSTAGAWGAFAQSADELRRRRSRSVAAGSSWRRCGSVP